MTMRGIILYFMLAVCSYSTTYYVRKDGSDSNAGTTDSAGGAFLTIGKASTLVNPGDTVIVKEGTWSERVLVNRAGASGNVITFQGQGLTTITGGFQLQTDYIHVKDFYFTYINSTATGQVAFGANSNEGKSTGVIGNYCRAENCKFDKWSGVQASAIINRPYYTAPVGCEWINNTFIPPTDLSNKTSTINIACVNGLFEGNLVTGLTNNDLMTVLGTGNIIRDNTFVDFGRMAGSTNHVDLFQAFSDSGEISRDHIIERNLMIDCGPDVQFGNITDDDVMERVKDWTIRNNIFIRHSARMNLYAPGFKFYNNTFYDCPNEVADVCLIRNSATRGSGANTKWFNNIFYRGGINPSAGNAGIYDASASPALTGFEANYNLAIGVAPQLTKTSAWTRYSANANSLNGVDPLFVNPIDADSAADVQLQAGSPAIGAGTNLSATGFTTDFYGNERGATWDIGAIEYNAGDTPTDTTAPTVTSATINSTGDALTLVFSENVFHVSEAHYALSGGQALGDVDVTGPVVQFSISPVVQDSAVVTLAYTSGAGRTDDAAGNLLATFSGFAVTNNSLNPTPEPPRGGRTDRKVKAVMQGR